MFTRLTALNWLLAAVAAWALGVAILALAGFGGRYRLHPDDPSLVPPLPSTTVQVGRSPLGPLELYAEAANRPLFYPDRKPARVKVGNDADAQQPLNVVLTSIIITPTLRMAIVRDTASGKSLRVREGQPLEGGPAGWKLVAISRLQAVFESGQGRSTLDLRVFDGQGAEPPTPNGLTPQAISAANASNIPASPAVSPRTQNNQVSPSGVKPNSTVPGILGAATVRSSPPASDDNADAERQAESIRQRIEARRRQAQDAAIATPPPSEKVQ